MIKYDYPLKKITTIGLGGKCSEYICPQNIEDIEIIMNKKNKLFIGNGSNVCFVTDHYDGVVISTKRMVKKISHDDEFIECSGNISCTKLARYLHTNNISGFEFLYGIPGTVGGAVYMNAGAFGSEILSYVHRIDLISSCGKIYSLNSNEINYSYRRSGIDNKSLILFIVFKNHQKKFNKKLLTDLNNKRISSQPVNQLSCGCIFKNPDKYSASKLIDGLNLKGKRVGGIYVSKKHANYFINDGSGTFHDFVKLLYFVKKEVSTKLNITLEEEVILVE